MKKKFSRNHIFLVPEGPDLKVVELLSVEELNHSKISTANATRVYYVPIAPLIEILDSPQSTRDELFEQLYVAQLLLPIFEAKAHADVRRRFSILVAKIRRRLCARAQWIIPD